MAWSHENVPRLEGRVIVVTGANSGIGLEASWMLAARGAHVVMACRDPQKAAGAVEVVRARGSGGTAEVLPLDLASLRSVSDFADTVRARFPALHALVNNAGVMALPFRTTVDGFEMQIGTNHFGHFALTGRLLDALVAGGTGERPSRVVTVSSNLHRRGRIEWDDLDGTGNYQKWARYGQSKLANLLFTFELDRRLRARGLPVVAVAAHPGYSATNLGNAGPRMEGSAFMERVMAIGNAVFAQSAQKGAWPTVYAAAAEGVAGGDYVGPSVMETWGDPKKVGSSAASLVEADQARLWQVSEARTGVKWLD
jgi:NAD(P)-dependent dehydrogenase (short-subunit alcohol dehydrogenase family)